MVTRLSDGLTPGDGSDPRTFPSIWNVTAGTIESQGSAITAAEADIDTLQSDVTAAESDIDDLEAKNIPSFGTAVPSDLQVLAFGTATSEFAPVTLDLDYLSDVSIGTAVSDGQVLAYSTAVSGWVNEDSAGGGGKILQVVQATSTSIFETSSTSYVDVTGLSVNITPSAATSKILVISSFQTRVQDSTAGLHMVIADGSDTSLTGSLAFFDANSVGSGAPVSLMIFDSPASTSSQTYKIRVKASATPSSAMQVRNDIYTGQIYAIEVAG